MPNPLQDLQDTVEDQISLSSGQMQTHLQTMHQIASQIGAFHMERVKIYQKTFDNMAKVKDFQDLLALQQDFIQTSMDNMLSHTKAMTEMLAYAGTKEFGESDPNK